MVLHRAPGDDAGPRMERPAGTVGPGGRRDCRCRWEDALGVAATAGFATTASANVEIGGTAGIHAFSTNNELGVPDVKDAPSERNSALFGLRLGMMFNDMLGIEGEFGVIPSESRSLVFDVWNVTYRAHLIAQFGAWRNGGVIRGHMPDCMSEIAKQLTPQETTTLAAWLAAQPVPENEGLGAVLPIEMARRCASIVQQGGMP